MHQNPAIIRRPALAPAKPHLDNTALTPCSSGDEDDDVHIPSDVDEHEISSIHSSPNIGPHTGPDGLLRERAGGSSGYELEDAEDLDTLEVERLLNRAIQILPDQAG
ncbi:hypothetical protein C8Q78DRAFT_1075125 [Trametes maxima]|nr:hypothetical protein C8Q78DRAFT_1075125 [Trametes maxima]